jgi:hypothetical protein
VRNIHHNPSHQAGPRREILSVTAIMDVLTSVENYNKPTVCIPGR